MANHDMAFPQRSLRELALFAGGGGGILGGHLLGWRTVCAVEIDTYCRSVLLARQRDGMLPRFPIWDDIRTFDGTPWYGAVDIVTGGFPCQDISAAGKGAGLAGTRSGLWFEMLRVIEEVRPRFVFAENSPNLRTRGLGTVLQGLAALGYDARWCVLGAWHIGAPHRRDRMWILAYSDSKRLESWSRNKRCQDETRNTYRLHAQRCTWWKTEPYLDRVVDRMADGMVLTRTIGQAQVPAVVATAWTILIEELQ